MLPDFNETETTVKNILFMIDTSASMSKKEITQAYSEITGAISLGQDTWEVTTFASGANDSQPIGYAASTELGMFREDDFGLSLSLDAGSVWNVTRDSYLTSLEIEEGAQILGADGAEVTMTVDGEETPIEAGTYAGEIVISIG